MDKKKTGEMIKEARIKKNYTQSELGDLLGVTNKAVSRWENGESFPDIAVLEHLSVVLNLSIQELVIGKEQADEEHAVTELLRLAKLQGRRKRKTYTYLAIGVILLLGCVFLGYRGFTGSGIGTDRFGISYVGGLASVLLLLIYAGIREKGFGKGDRKDLSCIAAVVMGIVALLTMCPLILHCYGKVGITLLNYEKIGMVLNSILILLWLVNLGILLVEGWKIYKETKELHPGIFILPANLFLTASYGDLLHRLAGPGEALGMLGIRTLVILTELVVALLVVKKGYVKRNNEFTEEK